MLHSTDSDCDSHNFVLWPHVCSKINVKNYLQFSAGGVHNLVFSGITYYPKVCMVWKETILHKLMQSKTEYFYG